MAKCDIKESSRLRAECDSDDSKERIKHFSRKGLNLPLSGLVPLAANSCSCSPGPGMLGSQCDALSPTAPSCLGTLAHAFISVCEALGTNPSPRGTHTCASHLPDSLVCLAAPPLRESQQGPRAGTPSLSHHPAHVSALYFRRATGPPPP